MIKIQAGGEERTINELQKFYKSYNPGFVFNYKFLDQDFQIQYAAEKKVASLSNYFAGLAIIISCLGLFGLVSFTTERRSKEIGIRKVLGSSELGVLLLLSYEFLKMVLLSISIALPVSYFIATNWLNNFAFRVELNLWYFLSTGGITLLIAWLTMGIQIMQASRVNPVKSLRSE